MPLLSPQKTLRELLHSRSAAASVIRVCAIVVLVQSAVFVARAPFTARRGLDDLLAVEIVTDETAVYRNGSYVNGKALASLLAHLVDTMMKRVKLQDADVKGPERLAQLKRFSDDQFWTVKRSLEPVLPGVRIIAPPDVAPSERPESAAVALPSRYLPELHKVVLFDQWVPADQLTVWMSPLSDSHEEMRRGGLRHAMTSVCVTHRGRPLLAAVAARDRVHWGISGRGNDLALPVGAPIWAFPERFGIAVDSPEAEKLAKRAFFEDADVLLASNLDQNLLVALSADLDAVLLARPVPLRTLCTGHLFLRLFGGKVTDLAGAEVQYPPTGGETEGTVLAALYYHKRMLQQVLDAKMGKNITREVSKNSSANGQDWHVQEL